MEITRLFDLMDWCLEKHPCADVLAGKRNGKWEKVSTQDYYKYSHLMACGFLEKGIQKGDNVITISNSRPEWNFVDMALSMTGAVHIPVYPTLNTDGYLYIFKHSEAKYIFVSNALQLKKIAEALEKMENAPLIYTFDPVAGKPLVSEFIDLGIATKDKNEPLLTEIKKSIQPDDLNTIVYTSGTTGDPKGVMLSHRNLVSNFKAHALHNTLPAGSKVLSFLPLCHIFERCLNYHYQYNGYRIYYAENIGTIAANINEVHTEGFCTVPRVLETVAEKFFAAGRELPLVSRFIYQKAINHGYRFDWNRQNPWYRFWTKVYDVLVYSKWREKLGGSKQVIICGGSAGQERIIRLFSAAGLYIYEGYGMTESSPVIAVNNPVKNRVKIGTVGEILAGVQVSFSDEGEILAKGPNVMLGYYKDPAYTAQVIDKEGWLHTGDIGELIDGRYLKITDRKKEIFKLSAGKYVAPQIIENKLKESNLIEQVMVVGENEKFASAIISPNIGELMSWADKNKVNYFDKLTLLNEKAVVDLFARIIANMNKTLAPHEQIKKFRLVGDEWTSANDLLSPTLKLRRAPLKKKYKELIEDIYEKNEEEAKVTLTDVSNISIGSIQQGETTIQKVATVITGTSTLERIDRRRERIDHRRARLELRRRKRQKKVVDRITKRENRVLQAMEAKINACTDEKRAARLKAAMRHKAARFEYKKLWKKERIAGHFEIRLLRQDLRKKRLGLKKARIGYEIAE